MDAQSHPSRREFALDAEKIDFGDVARISSVLGSAFVVLDARGTVLLANDESAALLDRRKSELAGCNLAALIPDTDALLASARADTPQRERRTLLRRDGTRVEISCTATRISIAGSSVANATYVVVFHDVSEYERLRVERDRLMQLAAVSDVLPGVLHELKNPLAAITSAVELVLEELGDGQARNDLQAVLGEIRRMKLTLEGIGSVGRDLVAVRPAAIDFAITEAFHVLLKMGESRGVRMECHVPAMPLLPFDPSVMRAIVFNLVHNAIHASETCGCTIRLHADFDRSTKVFELLVADTGEGMSEEVLARCTELFYTTKSRGSGMGLAIVRHLVEGAGGTLRIDTAKGLGTTIAIHVPVASSPRGPKAPPSPNPASTNDLE